ncbi:DUF4355 domain-containing protein [Lysinibacillus sp. CD3-6]|uniref:DUF4355 domain-containing protein n=1 Tax=Lysinibacillus sp. CD3-6 TaxID=2892541 RepID=UPI0011720EA5|nr:DUF4355 domain-containing protein [Lysinibacillus sp. CD3-6]UED81074.1 DUF4355 domain-containing protein [Lysinibacillus sp. CD3-6]
MKINLDKLKELVEAGDVTAIEKHVLEESLEKGDLTLAVKTNRDVKSDFESERDKHHTKALETWKSNNLEALIEEEVSKRNPQKTPEQIEIEKLRKEIEDERKGRERETLKTKAIEYATEQGLPTKFIERFLADDEESTKVTLGEYKAELDTFVQAQVDAKFKESGRDIDKPGQGGPTVTNLSELASAASIRK